MFRPISRKIIRVICRQDDASAEAQEVCDQLRKLFGNRVVGPRYDCSNERERANCALLIAIIGPAWHGDGGDARFLNDPHDPIRLEIEYHLAQKIDIIPVYVRDIGPLSHADLPDPLWSLRRKKAIQAPDADWERAIKELADRVRDVISPARPWVLLVNLLLLLLFVSWGGSWLSEATTIGEAIQAQWSLPVLGQLVLVVWGVVTQLFPYHWSPETARRKVSRLSLTAVLAIMLGTLCVFVSHTPVLVFRNTAKQSVRVRLYGDLSNPTSKWTDYKAQTVPEGSVRRWAFPFGSLAAHVLPAETLANSSRCPEGASVPLGIVDPGNPAEAKQALQEGCASVRMALPVLSRYFDPDPPEFKYSDEMEREMIVVEPSRRVQYKIKNQQEMGWDPEHPPRIDFFVCDRETCSGSGTDKAAASSTGWSIFLGKSMAIMTELPPRTTFKARRKPGAGRICAAGGEVLDNTDEFDVLILSKIFFQLPKKTGNVHTAVYRYDAGRAKDPERQAEFEAKIPDTKNTPGILQSKGDSFCLDFEEKPTSGQPTAVNP